MSSATGSAPRGPERPVEHPRPAGSDDATVAAVGKLSAAFEVVENARGMLYAFHRMSGEADLALQEAVPMLRDAGHGELADEIDEVLVGRDVVDGLWTFQIVESYDEQLLPGLPRGRRGCAGPPLGRRPARLRGRDEASRANWWIRPLSVERFPGAARAYPAGMQDSRVRSACRPTACRCTSAGSSASTRAAAGSMPCNGGRSMRTPTGGTPDAHELPGCSTPQRLFGRTAPLALEIGSGMGESTAAMAARPPAR